MRCCDDEQCKLSRALVVDCKNDDVLRWIMQGLDGGWGFNDVRC